MNILKTKRLSLNMTRKYVSQMTNLAPTTISNIEHGIHSTSFKNIIIYSKFLDIPLEDLAQEYIIKQNIGVIR